MTTTRQSQLSPVGIRKAGPGGDGGSDCPTLNRLHGRAGKDTQYSQEESQGTALCPGVDYESKRNFVSTRQNSMHNPNEIPLQTAKTEDHLHNVCEVTKARRNRVTRLFPKEPTRLGKRSL